jgi:hypothetical protein
MYDIRRELEVSQHMKNSIIAVSLWACAGLLISVGWGLYFITADRATPIGPMTRSLALLTEPFAGAVTVFYPDLALGLRTVVLTNIATYGLLALVVEAVRHRHRPYREK